MKKMLNDFFGLLMEPSDDCGLFPISARIATYGLVLLGMSKIIFGINSSIFILIVSFLAVVTLVELMWKRVGAGKKLWWHFLAMLLLSILLIILLNQATYVREWWYRTHVLEQRIEELILTAPQAIIVANGSGNIEYVNKYASELIGYTSDELAGKNLTILMRPFKAAKHQEAFVHEVKNMERGSAKWIRLDNKIFRIVTKDRSIIRTRIYIIGIRYDSNGENVKLGSDVEFYSIIMPIDMPLDDPEAVKEKIQSEVRKNIRDENKDKKEEADALKQGIPKFPPAINKQ